MQTITPYLYYEDVDRALEWLTTAFGFKKYGKQFTDRQGKTNHAAMKLKGGVIMMGCPGPKHKSPKRLGQTTQCLHILASNVDKLFERARNAGATVIQAPEDKFYGERQFGVADPEGHQWYFAEPIKKQSRSRKT